MRNRRTFYNKASEFSGQKFVDDVWDIYVGPNAIANLFMPNSSDGVATGWEKYSGCWRKSPSTKDVPVDASGNAIAGQKGYTPVHNEPHETYRLDLVNTYGKQGTESTMDYAGKTITTTGLTQGSYETGCDPSDYPIILTTFRLTEHFQGGPTTRNVAHLVEITDKPVVEINSADAALYASTNGGIRSGDEVYLASKRNSSVGPFVASVQEGSQSEQRVGLGVMAVPWHWGRGAKDPVANEGPSANDLTIDALDTHTTMPETKVCLVKVRAVRRGTEVIYGTIPIGMEV